MKLNGTILWLLISSIAVMLHAETVTLIQGENGYSGFRTDSYANENHKEKFNWWNHLWVCDDPAIGSNTEKADMADYCC